MSEYIPISEAALRNGVTVQALYQRVRRGTLSAMRHNPIICEMDVNAAQAAQRAKPGPKPDRRFYRQG